jgi:hypothetical protein
VDVETFLPWRPAPHEIPAENYEQRQGAPTLIQTGNKEEQAQIAPLK